MAHAQKLHFVFRLNGRVHLNRRGSQFSRMLTAEVCASAVVMLDTLRPEVVWEYWLPTPFASFPFTSPPVRHRVPPHSERSIHGDGQTWRILESLFTILRKSLKSFTRTHGRADRQTDEYGKATFRFKRTQEDNVRMNVRIARSEPGGTRWRAGGEVKGKLANGVGSHYSHATSERGLSSITAADAHNSAASSRLNWRPHRFKWIRPFRGKTKSGFCACAVTFRTSYTIVSR